ncbi:MAG: penicillin-binding transpeptidase domain-containing protein, partial [Anaerovoracaceae bacterium]
GKLKLTSRQRINVGFFLFLLILLALILRLAWIQIVKGDELSDKAVNQQLSDIQVKAKRGAIYDSTGKQLATNIDGFEVWIRPEQIRESYDESKRDTIAQELADLLDKKKNTILGYFKSKNTAVKISSFVDKNTRDNIRKLDITGLEFTNTTKRYYPMGSMCANLLGTVDSENRGRTGIEGQFDGYLSGISGRWLQDTDILGNSLSYGNKQYYKARDGYNAVLTIDEVLQHYAETAVKAGMKKTKSERIMFIAMDPKTGDILAMVTNPTFNCNNPNEPYNKADKEKFSKMSTEKQTEYLSEMWRNPIVSDLYEPGSCFKLINTSACLEEGVTHMNEKFVCKGYYTVNGVRIYCALKSGHGQETLKSGVGNSCNPVQMQLVARLGKDKYYDYLDLFGITQKTNVDLPGEQSAMIKDKDSISAVDLATMSFGQGIALTPIQMLTAACSIGNDGVLMKPRIVKKLTDSNGKTIKTYKTQEVRQVMSEKTASEMCTIMRYVVEKGGGSAAKIDGYSIGGKTGTAYKAKNGKYTKQTYASFLGMAPMDDPKIAVLCISDSPKNSMYGGVASGPIVKSFLKKALPYLNVDKHSTSSDDVVKVPRVKGMKASAAKSAITARGLKYKVVPKKYASKDFKVVDQYPASGEKISKGDTVYIYAE